MGWEIEQAIDTYYGKYRNGLFGKQHSINLFIYPSHIEGNAFDFYEGKLSDDSYSFEISYESIKKMFVDEIKNVSNITIEYRKNSVVQNSSETIILMGIEEPQKWLEKIEESKEKYFDELNKKKYLESEVEERQKQLDLQKEKLATSFYQECYNFHIKTTTPVYQLFADRNKIAVLYIDEDKGLNFLKIDGYAKEENIGNITYNNIHYYEKAGNVHYTTDIHGNYTSFGGSITRGNFSKLATIGGGLLFGLMGMAVGAALTYKPAEQKSIETNFSINSDVKTIDDRNVILNFYSDSKKQYLDIELPYDIYNFLSTHLLEKKYGIVDELEKRTAIHQSTQLIERGDLLNIPALQEVKGIEEQNENHEILFEQKVKKLKMMKDAGLLTEEEFENKRKELLDMI